MKAGLVGLALAGSLLMVGCGLLPQKYPGATPPGASGPIISTSDAEPRDGVYACPGLFTFAATMASYTPTQLEAAADGLRFAVDSGMPPCDQARLALLTARPGHPAFDATQAETHFTALLDDDIQLDNWSERLLISARDTLRAWNAEQQTLHTRVTRLEAEATAKDRTIQNMKEQINALTSIERSTDRDYVE